MGLRRRTALRPSGPPDREARCRSRGVKGAERGSAARGLGQGLLPEEGLTTRRSPHFQDAFHALLAVAFEKEQLLVTVDREGARHRRGERDLHGLPGRDLLLDCKARLGIIDEEIVRHQHGHALDGQFDRLTGPHDEIARAEFIAVGFDHGPLDAVRVQRNFNGKRIRGRARDDWQEGEQAGSDCENVQHCPDLLPEHYDTFSTCFGQEHSHEQAIPHTSILITSCDFQAVLLRHQYCTDMVNQHRITTLWEALWLELRSSSPFCSSLLHRSSPRAIRMAMLRRRSSPRAPRRLPCREMPWSSPSGRSTCPPATVVT